jgi:hypothetical protein
VVECTALEMRHARKGIGGSNPSLSAIKPFVHIGYSPRSRDSTLERLEGERRPCALNVFDVHHSLIDELADVGVLRYVESYEKIKVAACRIELRRYSRAMIASATL